MSGVPTKVEEGWVVVCPSASYLIIVSPEWISIALMVAPFGLDKLSHVVADKEPEPVKKLQPEVMTEGLKVWKYWRNWAATPATCAKVTHGMSKNNTIIPKVWPSKFQPYQQ